MRDGKMTVRDVIMDAAERIGTGDDAHANLRDALMALNRKDVKALEIEVPDAVVTADCYMKA